VPTPSEQQNRITPEPWLRQQARSVQSRLLTAVLWGLAGGLL